MTEPKERLFGKWGNDTRELAKLDDEISEARDFLKTAGSIESVEDPQKWIRGIFVQRKDKGGRGLIRHS